METAPTRIGWKIGEIAFDGRSSYLRSGAYGVRTAIEDIALCFEHVEHTAPEPSCSCGFYASPRPEPLIVHARAPYSQLFAVELGGRVIATRESSRGETQHVLQVHVNPTCYRCRRPAVLMCTDPAREASSHPSRLSDALISSCAVCATNQRRQLSELERELGVEVRWSRPELTIVLLGAGSFH